jgi:polyhydroxyalkanoate synthase
MTTPEPFERSAPRPLSVYLGAAMTMLGPEAGPEEQAVHRMAMEKMLLGIRKYQAHTYRRPAGDLAEIWQKESSTLSFCPANPAKEKAGAILMVPSMINGPEILDLLPGRSFVRWMAEQGFDVYLLDWGKPATDAGLRVLDAGVLQRLIDAAGVVHDHHGGPVDALGYCMGGTLLLGAAATRPALFKRLVLLSAPWDFHAGDPRMMAQVITGTPSALSLLEEKSALPVDWIQNVFARVNPRIALDKFAAFLEMPEGSEEEKVFIAVEDWLNSGQDLSAGVARSCIMDWYAQNKPVKGGWVDLTALAGHPVLVVAAGKDILVPPESAAAVVQSLPHALAIRPPCGHICLMAGRTSRTMLWEPVRDWLNPLA